MIADFGSLPAFNSKHTVGVSKLLGLVYTGSSSWCPSSTDIKLNAFIFSIVQLLLKIFFTYNNNDI